MKKTILVTGAAGFIGFHLSTRLLSDEFKVVGIDSLSDYYDPTLKQSRQNLLLQDPNFLAVNKEIQEPGLMKSLFKQHRPDFVVHLAAQAGVRYSIENPRT